MWNVENKICGSTDIDLTEKGHEQAVETGKKILSENIKADIILYSPLMRAEKGLSAIHSDAYRRRLPYAAGRLRKARKQ